MVRSSAQPLWIWPCTLAARGVPFRFQSLMDEFDREQLHEALAGNPAAVRALVALLTPIVRARVARALTRHRRNLDAELGDFTQEVFVALFTSDAKALRAWDPSRGLSFVNFVGLLAQHRVADLLRTQRWRQRQDDVELDESQLRAAPYDADSVTDTTLASQERLSLVLEYMEAKLSERGIEMFQRLYVQEQSVEQVAAATGVSHDAVYQWRSRLSKLAREALSELERIGSSTEPQPSAAVRVDRVVRRS